MERARGITIHAAALRLRLPPDMEATRRIHRESVMSAWLAERERQSGMAPRGRRSGTGSDDDAEPVIVNLIDSPGHVDFAGEVAKCSAAVDGALVIVDAEAGVQPGTRGVLRNPMIRDKPLIAVINKVDRLAPGDAAKRIAQVSASLAETAGRPTVAWSCVQPHRIWSGWDGLEDAADEADLDIATTWQALAESLAEHDEAALESYAAQGESLTVDQASAAMARVTRAANVMPVLTASALRGWGVHPVLRALRDWLPEAGATDAPTTTRVFKVVHTHERGLVSFARVTGRQPLRIGERVGGAKVQRILEVQADEWSEVKELAPGDIGALVGAVHGEASDDVAFAPPVYQVCLEVESDREERALEEALAYLVVEDPTAAYGRSDQNELLLRGQGELHVETLVHRLRTHYKATTVEAVRPSITYRATTTVPTTKVHDCTFRVGSSGTQCSMTLHIALTPTEEPGPVTVRVRSSGNKGVRDALSAGVLAGAASGLLSGFSLQSTAVTIELTNAKLSGSNDDLPHLRAAAARCLLDTAREAGPQLLEPVMTVSVELSTPDHFGTVLSDLTGSRRAIIQSVNPAAGACVALVPAEELLGYASRLRSISSGHGSFTSALTGYEPVPPEIQQRVLLDRGVVQVE